MATVRDEDQLVNRFMTRFARDEIAAELARVEAAKPDPDADSDEEWRVQRENQIAALHHFVGFVSAFVTSTLPPANGGCSR